MKKYLKTQAIEVISRTETGDYMVQNEGKPDDKWIIPQDVFEATYTEITYEGMSFEQMKEAGAVFGFDLALNALEEGHKVARSGWNGKGMWLEHISRGKYAVSENDGESGEVGFHRDLTLLPWIGMKTADNKFVPWLASQTDLLAKDWVIV